MITIRKVGEADSGLILNWRNNPEVYRYALNPNPVKKEEHQIWFAQALMDTRCIFFMGLFDDVPCGVVRYQLSENLEEAEVSISLAPEFWGKKIATTLMNLAEAELKNMTKVKIINATVLNENVASMKLFSNANFKPFLTKFKKEI